MARAAKLETIAGQVQEEKDLWKLTKSENSYISEETESLDDLLERLGPNNQKLLTAEQVEEIKTTGQVTIGSRTIVFGLENEDVYLVGDKVTLGTGENAEDFYVIENSYSGTSTVKLITENCVKTTDNYKQQPDGSFNSIKFDDYENTYSGSYIEGLVNSYKEALESRIQKTVDSARLMETSEVTNLGATLEIDTEYGDKYYDTSACTNEKAFLNTTSFWLGTHFEDASIAAWSLDGPEKQVYLSSIERFCIFWITTSYSNIKIQYREINKHFGTTIFDSRDASLKSLDRRKHKL